MNIERINRAIDIINYAINNEISLSLASEKNGFAKTYVKNVKIILYEKYEDGLLDDDVFNKFNEIYKKYEINKNRHSKNKPELPNDDMNEKTISNFKEDNGEINWYSGKNYPSNHIKTLDDLIKECNINTDIWKIKEHTINKWDTTSWKKTQPETIQNFQVKVRLEKNLDSLRTINAVDIFADMVKKYQPPLLKYNDIYKKSNLNNENNLLEVSIFDLHMGKLAWGGETGENYDVKIASERFIYSINKLIERASSFNFSKIVFPIGSDFFNSDTIINTTTKGTIQDEDLRWQKTFKLGINLVVDGIELLKQTGVPVDVVVIPGNHDFERSFYMGEFLTAWYRNDDLVKIDNGASPRKYYVFGNVLLGFTHGSEEKEASLPLIMANDTASKKHWSNTKFHEWHVGHIHRKRNVKYSVLDKNRELNEDLGVTIRYLSSLTGTEEWHHKKGFIGQVKAADAFIWNDEYGYVAHLNSNLIIEEYKE